MAYDKIVETAPTAVEHEDMVPCCRVKFVATAWGQANIDALAFRHSFPLAVRHIAIHSIKGDSTSTVVGIKVDGDLPTNPILFRNRDGEIAGWRVVRQNDALNEERIGVASREEHVNTAVRRGAVGVGSDRLIEGVTRSRLDRRKHRAIAIAVVADAEQGAPPFAQLVAFNLDDTA